MRNGPSENIEELSDFECTSSFGPESNMVRNIAECHEIGRPVALYELAQGMLDYGLEHSPPPHIRLYLDNGESIVWDGTDRFLERAEQITSVEFYNSGPGLTPEDTVIIRHGGGDDTLGQHGRGTTAALTYLAEKGITVHINSNCIDPNGDSRLWKGRTKTVKTISGSTRVLSLKGEWGEKIADDNQNTRFIVNNPTKNFLKDIAKLSDVFLFANPNFPGACMVEKSGDAEKKLPGWDETSEYGRNNGKIQCVDSIFPKKRHIERHNTIFIDGLEVDLPDSSPSILQWSIMGFSREDSWYVRRSEDSRRVDSPDLVYWISNVIRDLDDPVLISKLICAEYEDPKSNKLEFNTRRYGLNMGQRCAELIRKEWKTNYKDAKITTSHEQEAKYNKLHAANGLSAAVVSNELYRYLKDAGVPTLESELGKNSEIDLGSMDATYVPEMESDQERLFYFFEELGRQCSEVEISMKKIKDEKKLAIGIPTPLINRKEFLGHTHHNYGPIVRLAFGIANSSDEIEVEALALDSKHVHIIEVDSYDDYNDVSIDSKPRNELEADSDLQDGYTYILLKSPNIGTDPTLGQLMKVLEAARKAVRQNIEKARNAYRDFLYARGQYQPKQSWLLAQEQVLSRSVKHRSIGQISPDTKRLQDGLIMEHKDNKLKPGFWRMDVFNSFNANGSANWNRNNQLIAFSCPQTKLPKRKYENKVHANGFEGEVGLPVKSEDQIVAIEVPEGSEIALYRDIRTGVFYARGETEDFVYYTKPDETAEKMYYQHTLPLPIESRSHVNIDSLERRVGGDLRNAKQHDKTDQQKLSILLRLWHDTYIYSKDMELDRQVEGDTPQSVVTNMLNTMSGICNLSASSFCHAVRAVGIPARVSSGQVVHEGNKLTGETHMIVEVYIHDKWVEIDPTSLATRADAHLITFQPTGLPTKHTHPYRTTIAVILASALLGILSKNIMTEEEPEAASKKSKPTQAKPNLEETCKDYCDEQRQKVIESEAWDETDEDDENDTNGELEEKRREKKRNLSRANSREKKSHHLAENQCNGSLIAKSHPIRNKINEMLRKREKRYR